VEFSLLTAKEQWRKQTAKDALSDKFSFCCKVGIYLRIITQAGETPADVRQAFPRVGASARHDTGP
jgi:hypothetical protein